MKRIGVLIVLCMMLSPVWMYAQDEMMKGDPDARQQIEAARIALITNRLGLTPEQAERFWPIYREFNTKRGEISMEFRQKRQEFDATDNDPKRQQEMVDAGLQFKQRELDLERDYSGKLLRVISAQQFMNLRNAEKEFQRMILNQLQQRQMMQQRRDNLRNQNQQLRQRKNEN
ncbi:MAG: hypothetical protein HC811_07235 [Flammeovirgaceae bacterium]|nr:hypothetical protein [Flammeovirgaceae bacterium]